MERQKEEQEEEKEDVRDQCWEEINEFNICRYGLTTAQGTAATNHQKSNSTGLSRG